MHRVKAFQSVLFIIIFVTQINAQQTMLIDNISIPCKPGSNRVFTFTNKHYSQFHGETNSYSSNGWHGWICREQKIFIDFQVTQSGKIINRKKAHCTVTPYNILRRYPGKISEELLLLDSVDAFILKYNGLSNPEFTFTNFQGGRVSSLSPQKISWDLSANLPGYQMQAEISTLCTIQADTTVNGRVKIDNNGKPFILLFSIRKNTTAGISLAETDQLIKRRKDRINAVLEHCKITTTNKEFDKAYLWACASVDALVTTQDVKGIFAGLPWFNNNWGRDTFISLPGACLANGFYTDAKDILTAFGAFQDTVSGSQYFGRIPNRVTLQDVIYNTTDGTPYFIMQAYNYWKLTGDDTFIKSIMPKLKLAHYAAKEKFVDTKGFLTHADAETWMDAVGPEGPWSPRGNRANDIQVLWRKQLQFTAEIAKHFQEKEFAADCIKSEQLLIKNFSSVFISPDYQLADRIKKDNAADYSIRPNAFIALEDTILIPEKMTRSRIFNNSFSSLVTPYGALSLSYRDKNFHPFHEYPPYYPKDAAYHNGIIWQWNIGPVITNLCRAGFEEKAMTLTNELNRQILHQGAVGTIAELMEALPRKGKHEILLSGAFSQAWSLAEYIRNIREDYLGIRTDFVKKEINISPAKTFLLQNSTFPLFYGESVLSCNIKKTGNDYTISLQRLTGSDNGNITFNLPVEQSIYRVNFQLDENIDYAFRVNEGNLSVKKTPVNNVPYSLQILPQHAVFDRSLLTGITFAKFELDSTLNIFKKPAYPMYNNNDIKKASEKAVALITAGDAAHDEAYLYPTNPNFKPGILDIKRTEIKEDASNYFFTLSFSALANPQWHPEYGFQLTIAGIYINNGSNGSNHNAFKNTNYTFPENRQFNKVIFIGGGLEVWNAQGEILASYLPAPGDAKQPLGDAGKGEIYFSLPKPLIGKITKDTQVTVLIGAQDDHGGAGLGEFRKVLIEQAEWNGGGKKHIDEHNVYDFMYIN